MSRAGRQRRVEERGAETVAMLFVIPVLVVLVLALIDVGMMFRARMLVENVYRDAARGAAADGGNYFDRTNTIGKSWEQWGQERLYGDGACKIAACAPGEAPTIDCSIVTDPNGNEYRLDVAPKAGHTITCRGHYPYKPINGALLNGPIGLGMGTLLKEFDVSVSARAETGQQSAFG